VNVLKTDDFDYHLPEEMIAQGPAIPRESCRLLVMRRNDGLIEHTYFFNILNYLKPGDLLVVNVT